MHDNADSVKPMCDVVPPASHRETVFKAAFEALSLTDGFPERDLYNGVGEAMADAVADAVLVVTGEHERLAVQAERDRINHALDQIFYRLREDWGSSGGRFQRREAVPTFDCADVRRVIADA